MLTPLDDLPIHQVAETMATVGTSDRNFYDRYYFNLHGCSDELFLIMGIGQYPNLGVQDAFACVRRGDKHRVVGRPAARAAGFEERTCHAAGQTNGDCTFEEGATSDTPGAYLDNNFVEGFTLFRNHVKTSFGVMITQVNVNSQTLTKPC